MGNPDNREALSGCRRHKRLPHFHSRETFVRFLNSMPARRYATHQILLSRNSDQLPLGPAGNNQ